jgi:hypothetical protein
MGFADRKPMPKGWKSPLRAPLYLVVVERTADGAHQAVGPAMLKDYADLFAGAISDQIKAGAEKHWSNPTVIRA